jgi:cytochrome c biogenesis protein CcmG/thiol:disulfide interchange protein DsbE
MSDTPTSPAMTTHPTGDRRWRIVALLAGLVLIGFIVFVATRDPRPKPVAYPMTSVATLPVGSSAPAFTLPRLGGGPPVAFASAGGTPTVVNFFASWCLNCQAELSAIAMLAAHTVGHVAVIGVDANDANGPAAQKLLDDARATYPVGVDSQATTATTYLLTALPVTFFLDARGRVVHVAQGIQRLPSLMHWTDLLTAGPTR